MRRNTNQKNQMKHVQVVFMMNKILNIFKKLDKNQQNKNKC